MHAIFELLMGFIYMDFALRFGRTASRRYAHRAQRPINKLWLIIWSLLWPIWMTMWLMVSIAAGQRLPSLLREPSKADRRKADLARLKEERSRAIQDWQRRASYWYELGQKAEAEDDQALKWAVAENLNFLLETKPEGAKVAGLTAPETGQQAVETIDSDKPIEGWASYSERQRALKAQMRIQKRSIPKSLYVGSNTVSFCNACSRYRQGDQMTMRGVCDECAIEQGL